MTRAEVLKLENIKDVEKAVGIAGTDYDRRRKLTKAMVNNIRRSFNAGKKSIPELADKYGVSQEAIRYWVDEDYKEYKNSRRKLYKNSSTNTPEKKKERGHYKRMLVDLRRKVIYK